MALMNFFKREADCYQSDWGEIRPEGYDPVKKELLNIYNLDIGSEEYVHRAIILLAGKTMFNYKHAPEGTSQKIVIDLRGQPLSLLDRARKMKSRLLTLLKELNYDSPINIEILI